MSPRQVKNLLYEQVTRIGKAVASPRRLELLELLSQCEKSVETLAKNADLSVKLASVHLKELKAARLVDSRKAGRRVYYRLADPAVASLCVMMRMLAEERLLDLQDAIRRFVSEPGELFPADRHALLGKARRGEVIIIDVRPDDEYQAGHLPYARSLPLGELKKRLARLPKDKEIIAYCRGPYCMMAKEAVALLRRRGYQAAKLGDGVNEWRAAGLALAVEQ